MKKCGIISLLLGVFIFPMGASIHTERHAERCGCEEWSAGCWLWYYLAAAVIVFVVGIILMVLAKRRRRSNYQKLCNALGCLVARKNMSKLWQYEDGVVYRYEYSRRLGFPSRFRIERAFGEGKYLVKTQHCVRDTSYLIRDTMTNYVTGDFIEEGYYKCAGVFRLDDFVQVRVLERVRITPELEHLRLSNFKK